MKTPNLKIIETEDGSHSLYREDLNETYHSFHGARGESEHVFILNGLSTLSKPEIRVFEVGMGTGLNVFLSALMAKEKNISIYYETIEPIPIEKLIYQELNYGKSPEEMELLQRIHSSDWQQKIEISPNFQLKKRTDTLESIDLPTNHFDVIYFDAFAPSKQPEIWSVDNIQKCFDTLRKDGILTTYCAQGLFKRNLKSVGFVVESLPGAPGKKEMVRATKPI